MSPCFWDRLEEGNERRKRDETRMPPVGHHHREKHFTASETIRDAIIGLSDGLTVPFALAAGLSGAVDSTHIVVIAGLSEIAAGTISMGLGGYLATRSQEDHYNSELRREKREVKEIPEEEMEEVSAIFREYGVQREESDPLVKALTRNPQAWVDFMMRFELGLEKPEGRRAYASAAVIGLSYAIGGLIPLTPYMLVHQNHMAFPISVGVTLLALFIFGYIKGRFLGVHPWRGALQTLLIGGIAAFVAFVVARMFA